MTANEYDPVAELGETLSRFNVAPRINRARIARPTLHDPIYHIAIIALAMREHGSGPSRRIRAPWLQLLQFVAARPALVENLLEYGRTRRSGNLEKGSLMPRGYMGDQTHDSVVDFLAAVGALRRDGDYLEGAANFGVLDRVAVEIATNDLFRGERDILEKLREIRPSKALLGGS